VESEYFPLERCASFLFPPSLVQIYQSSDTVHLNSFHHEHEIPRPTACFGIQQQLLYDASLFISSFSMLSDEHLFREHLFHLVNGMRREDKSVSASSGGVVIVSYLELLKLKLCFDGCLCVIGRPSCRRRRLAFLPFLFLALFLLRFLAVIVKKYTTSCSFRILEVDRK
jgi:hypothetical protein